MKKKKNKHPHRSIIAIVFAVSIIGDIVAAFWTSRLANKVDAAKSELMVAVGQSDNEAEAARQWKEMYQSSLLEIADLKEENEELTRCWEEVSFAYGEVCEETGWTGDGEFRITHYCSCPLCCGANSDGITATGTAATAGRTIAVDPSVIPLGSKVLINGVVYLAEDTGGCIKGNRIDLFVDDHEQAVAMGTYTTSVCWR